MTRNLRNHHTHEDNKGLDDEAVHGRSTRSSQKVNYAEVEHNLDYLEDEELGDTPAEPEHDEKEEPDYVEHQNGARRGQRRGSRRAHDPEEDDESFHEDDVDESLLDDDNDDDDEDFQDGYYNERDHIKAMEQRADRNFIVPDPKDEDDDDDDEENINYGSRRRLRQRTKRRNHSPTPPRRSLRSLRHRTRSSHYEDEEDHHYTEPVTLQDELRELQQDSPINEKRSLRERTKPVDYTIPPPLAIDDLLSKQNTASMGVSPRRGRPGGWGNSQNAGPARRLFPTGGPFGGNDVTTIFGRNTNFYNQGPDGAFTALGAKAPGMNKRFIDSDSSEDEILPMGVKPKSADKFKKKKKKKPEIADLDPLGVDMNISFDDVGGLDNYIDQLKEMVTLPLLYPELYQNFNITPPRGVLFHGPPGTGKTLMARALAASCSSETRKITFFMRKGADILSKWVGEAERQLRLLFEEAKKQQPSIIFFDEIDGLAPVRSSKQEQIHASIVSTMLALMDGMDNRGQVIVIGATNRPDAVDPALRRPGRFDREFYFPLPDLSGRAKILQIHTNKWNPKPSDAFIKRLAELTKGFGGADLRALCTEAALMSIQRKYPQIYRSKDKLLVDPQSVKVGASDFMLALQKIVPSSARSAESGVSPLPDSVKPLLDQQYTGLKVLLDRMLPKKDLLTDSSKSMIQQFLAYEDFDNKEDEGRSEDGFAKYTEINRISDSRIYKPRLLITGLPGNGQQYIGPAILNELEHYNVQRMDLASLASESTRTIESAVVQGFIEARKRQPSVIFIPDIDIWSVAIPESALLTLASLLRSLKSNERVLVLAIADSKDMSMLGNILRSLQFSRNTFEIQLPSSGQISHYFESLIKTLQMKPTAFAMKVPRQRPLPELPLAPVVVSSDELDENGQPLGPDDILRKKLKSFQHQDMKLKNMLKIKLSGLMDLFKNRYKRFRKPPIEDAFLVHLFEPQPATVAGWQPAYVKDDDMILEVSTGRRFHNMDLDIVEERLWNGYYSEPRQFLKDIEMIYQDANTMGDRERIIRASEMFANAQMGIEDISVPEFIQECRATRKRDLERQALFLRDEQQRIAAEASAEAAKSAENVAREVAEEEVGVADGSQMMAQKKRENVNGEGTAAVHSEEEDKEPAQLMGISEIGSSKQNSNKQEFAEHDPSEHNAAEHDSTEYKSQTEGQEGETDKNDNRVGNPSMPVVENTQLFQSKDISPEVADGESVGHLEKARPTDKEEPQKVDERVIVLDIAQLHKVIPKMVEKCRGLTVSELEDRYSEVMDIIWSHRHDWDKSSAVEEISSYIESLQNSSFN